jgi:NB-ARC domain
MINLSLDRSRLGVLLTALEIDLRDLMRRHLLKSGSPESILLNFFQGAEKKMNSDQESVNGENDIYDYLDLGDAIQVLYKRKAELPEPLQQFIVSLETDRGLIVQVRNRIAHSRALLPGDVQSIEYLLSPMEKFSLEMISLSEVINHLVRDRGWSPPLFMDDDIARVLNNLPLPDYDDTGLVGRKRELEQLKRKIVSLPKRNPVLTIVGPGGIGKTALALDALLDLVNQPNEFPFDQVVWISLKTEQLTARGVQQIADSLRSLEAATPFILRELDPDFEGGLEEISAVLEDLQTLIVIDNLETVSGDEVVKFIDALPDSVCYLFTSRIGIGQLEVRFPLGPLEEKQAVRLLHLYAQHQYSNYLKNDDIAAARVVDSLGCSPLAIRWFMAAVSNGKDPEFLLSHKGNLTRFCVENVFDSMDSRTKDVAEIIDSLSRPVTTSEIQQHTDIENDELRNAIQTLDQRMLITKANVPGGIAQTFQASRSLSDYLSSEGWQRTRSVAEIQAADQYLLEEQEINRIRMEEDPLLLKAIFEADQHPGSLPLLRKAFSASGSGKLAEALALLDQAQEMDSEWSEIYRIKAFILSKSNPSQACDFYEKAINLSRSTKESARIRYFYAPHLSHNNRSREGLREAIQCHEFFGNAKTAFVLGNAYLYELQYEKAAEILDFSATISLEGSSREGRSHPRNDQKTFRMAISSLLEVRKREATDLRSKFTSIQKLQILGSAIQRGSDGIALGGSDEILVDKFVSCCNLFLQTVNSLPRESDVDDSVMQLIDAISQVGPDVLSSFHFPSLRTQVRILEEKWPSLPKSKARIIRLENGEIFSA